MSDWPGNGPSTPANSSRFQTTEVDHLHSPELTVASVMPESHRLADDLVVRLSRSSSALVWLQGPPGAGKSSFLIDNVPRWPFASLWLDLRQECEVMASFERVMSSSQAPVLILDDMSPADLLHLVSDPQHPAAQIVPSYPGPILLASAEVDQEAVPSLTARVGRRLESVSLPSTSVEFRLSILRAKQSQIERRWGVQILPGALRRAAAGNSLSKVLVTPGLALDWLNGAAARVAMAAELGDHQLRGLEARVADLNRALLVAQARQEGEGEVLQALQQAEIERAAYLVDWHERRQAGDLNRVDTADVDYEIRACVAPNEQVDVSGRSPGTRHAEPGSIAEDA